MTVRFRILAGLLIAAPAATAVAAEPPAATSRQPEFLVLARPPAKVATGDQPASATEPRLIVATSPVATRTVAQRDADGRVHVQCKEVPHHGALIDPRRREQQP